MVLMGGLCCLLACIGFVNVFSNTLGYINQRIEGLEYEIR